MSRGKSVPHRILSGPVRAQAFDAYLAGSITVEHYPNPSSRELFFRFHELNREITLSIYSGSGQLVKVLNEPVDPFLIKWDGNDHTGRRVRPGCYLYQVDLVNPENLRRSFTDLILHLR